LKFSAKTDIQAPLNATFEALADFEFYERRARRGGTNVARADDLARPGRGMRWDIKVEYKGKIRGLLAELTDYDPPESLDFAATLSGFDATLRVDLIALSARETRLDLALEVRANTLPARLTLQGARLARGKLVKQLRVRLEKFGRDVHDRVQSA